MLLSAIHRDANQTFNCMRPYKNPPLKRCLTSIRGDSYKGGGFLNGIPLMGARFFLARRRCYPPPPGGDNKKNHPRRTHIFEFSACLQVSCRQAENTQFWPAAGETKKGYIVYTMGKHNKRAAGEKNITFLCLEPILSVSKQHPLSQIKLSNPGLN